MTSARNIADPRPGARSCGLALAGHHRDLRLLDLGRQAPDRAREFAAPVRGSDPARGFELPQLSRQRRDRRRPRRARRPAGVEPVAVYPIGRRGAAGAAAEPARLPSLGQRPAALLAAIAARRPLLGPPAPGVFARLCPLALQPGQGRRRCPARGVLGPARRRGTITPTPARGAAGAGAARGRAPGPPPPPPAVRWSSGRTG